MPETARSTTFEGRRQYGGTSYPPHKHGRKRLGDAIEQYHYRPARWLWDVDDERFWTKAEAPDNYVRLTVGKMIEAKHSVRIRHGVLVPGRGVAADGADTRSHESAFIRSTDAPYKAVMSRSCIPRLLCRHRGCYSREHDGRENVEDDDCANARSTGAHALVQYDVDPMRCAMRHVSFPLRGSTTRRRGRKTMRATDAVIWTV